MAAKYRVEITRTAESDVEEIWTHIGADSIEHATKFVLQLEKKTDTLERMSHRCPLIPENKLLGTNYRHLDSRRLSRDLPNNEVDRPCFADSSE